ncbi:receptor-like serine/threonine-protein kinase ALE2 isoform X4 [Ananas comosus]|uniref:Receptor-like serine/threonine-protein kinase ALE2 isoform X4 n=1 Tax=Ananas comosus TaxID=4615 RepID=A0A6P5GZS8_ANACO|nr:receptor-like serine/threonine-protein kinase ALE2 isoform X4 [Ananas comosus]
MGGGVMLLLALLHLSSLCFGLPWHTAARVTPTPSSSPSIPPEIMPSGPRPAPAYSPTHPGPRANPPLPNHRKRMPHVIPSPSFIPPQAGCEGILCSDPLTSSPLGSPCGCVLPIKVIIDLGIAPYLLFMRIAELEVEVADGTFLKQSQVKIMAAVPSIQDQQKTRITIYLVPLGQKFDNTTALLIYERVCHQKMPLNMSIFGDYEVLYVHYPGLPSSPTSVPRETVGFGPSGTGIDKYPFTADVPTSRTRKLNAGIVAVIVVSSCTVILACVGVVLFVLKWRKLGRPPSVVSPAITQSIPKRSGMRSTLSSSMASSISVSDVPTMATCPLTVKMFSLRELEKATDGFSLKRVLGEGGFGRVYHGTMEDGSEVAVKKLLRREDQSGDREFIAEVEILSRLHHRNLVKLIGICIDGSKRCLIYELICNGSVESHLHGADKIKGLLNWDLRMKIALGAARGLAYLHEDSNPCVIHRDFKASNILLEEDFNPKVTDFGLAREASEGSHHISTRVMGTFGYVAPEYAMTGHLLVKSDVYSYGVVLLELLSGRKPVYISQSQDPENLVTWARPLLSSREGLEKLIDPSLNKIYDFDNVAKVASIASMCVHTDPSQRPFMGEVVQALKLVYNDNIDETFDDSCSQRASSSAPDYNYKGELDNESSWWNGGSPTVAYGHSLPFITMECSSDRIEEERQRPHSTSSFVRRDESTAVLSLSDPLRNNKFAGFYHSRGSTSEHGHLSHQLGVNRH